MCDEADNCPTIPNPDRRDGDQDQIGDVCDACPAAPGHVGAIMPGQDGDGDGDGRLDVCDACPADATDACATFLGCTGGGALVRVAAGAEGASFIGWLGTRCNGLTRDPATGALHTLSFDPVSQSLAVYSVDPVTAVATLVGPLDPPLSPSGLGRAADGRLMTITRGAQRPLVAIDSASGATTVVGNSGLADHAHRGIADDGGTLLAADAVTLLEVDADTGAPAPLATLTFPIHCGGPQDRDIDALVPSTNGELYALMRCFHPQYSYLATIDRQTGAVAFAGGNLPRMTGLVPLGAAVPERCYNCLDDDGDGLVDLADPACCLEPTPLAPTLRRSRLRDGRDGLSFDLRADLDTTALEIHPPPLAAVALQLDDPATGERWCARAVQEDFVALRADRLWRHRGDGPLRQVTLAHTTDPRTTRLRVRGRGVPLAESASLELRIGLQQGVATRPLCFAGSAAEDARGAAPVIPQAARASCSWCLAARKSYGNRSPPVAKRLPASSEHVDLRDLRRTCEPDRKKYRGIKPVDLAAPRLAQDADLQRGLQCAGRRG